MIGFVIKKDHQVFAFLVKESEDQNMQPISAPIMTLRLAKSSTHPQHQYVLLAHLKNYMVDDDSDPIGEELMHFASFPNCDPLSHEEATQNDC